MNFVQASPGASVYQGGVLTATASLSGVNAGDFLIALVLHTDFGGTAPTFTITDSQTGTPSYNQDVNSSLTSSQSVNAISSSLANVAAGAHTVTVVASSGTSGNSFFGVQLLEFSGMLLSSVFDKSAVGSSATSNTPATGTSPALSQTNEVIVALLTAAGSLSGATVPPTGGPGTFISSYSSLGLSIDMDYQLDTSSTSGVSANWGTTTASNIVWAGAVATYKGQMAAAGGGGQMGLMGVGK